MGNHVWNTETLYVKVVCLVSKCKNKDENISGVILAIQI